MLSAIRNLFSFPGGKPEICSSSHFLFRSSKEFSSISASKAADSDFGRDGEEAAAQVVISASV
jgi:hypothetical protein